MPWTENRARGQRLRQLGPFMLLAGIPIPLSIVSDTGRTGLVIASLLLTGAVAASIVLVPWHRLPLWPQTVPLVLYCLAVVAARGSQGGSTSGLSVLLLAPVVWQALYGTKRYVAVAVALSTLALVIPIVVVGGADYPPSEWNRAAAWAIAVGCVGMVVHGLVNRLRANEASLARITNLAHGLTMAGDNRESICRGALEVARAETVYLLEPAGGDLRPTAVAGLVSAACDIDMAENADARRVFHAGQERLVTAGSGAALFQPVRRGTGVVGVLAVVWDDSPRALSGEVQGTMRLLAVEAAFAMERADQLDAAVRQARIDPLTGLPNRRLWDEEAARVLAAHRRSDEVVSVGMIDIDHFKRFNDTHGHQTGDLLLKEAAAAWRERLREGDLLARWGGEEFAVLLPSCSGGFAAEVLDRLRAATPRRCSCSIGITEVRLGEGIDEVVARADAVLYEAKQAGRDRVVLADRLLIG